MRLHPLGIFIEGRLEQGLEIELEPHDSGDQIVAIRASNQRPQPILISPAFANAHSHFEYRALQGKIAHNDYWRWIRELTVLKAKETQEQARQACLTAAAENRQSGIAVVAEHSDRPYAAEAIADSHLQGRVYQELITFMEQTDPDLKWMTVKAKCEQQRKSGANVDVQMTPHSAYTVDEASLKRFADERHFSIHVAETPLETQFFRDGEGPIAELYRGSGFRVRRTGQTVVQYLNSIGLVKQGAQFVHCCAIETSEIGMLAEKEVSIAHCPRSNIALGCPNAPIRRLWDAGCEVGLGLDSPASSGPIDMFAEMRAAMDVAALRGEPLTAEMVWLMATTVGARSIGYNAWEIKVGNHLPLLAIRTETVALDEIIELSQPSDVTCLKEIIF